MADVNISKYRASVVRDGSKPASPGFVVSEGQNPTDPAGSGQNHLPVTIAPVSTALAITDNQILSGAGTVGQYIRGDGSLADFPQASGGGSSVSYYLNGSVNQGTIGGVAYRELSKVPILGAGTQFTINADGYIAQFLTDAGDPNLLEIPGGNWNFETYFSASSSGGTPTFYVELYKYDGTTFTLIASSSTSPEFIAFGTNLTPYYSTLAVPTTALALTDRLAVRYYVNHSGRTITLHTENNTLCQIVTTFTTGLTSLNGLTAQVQNLAVGTSGTDFNIASATATHTFNLPTASATNRGALSSTDWTTFNNKQNALTNPVTGTGTTNYLPKFTGITTIGNSQVFDNGTNVGINTNSPGQKFTIVGSNTLQSLSVGTDTTHQILIGADSSYAEIQGITQGVAYNKNLILQRQGANVLIGTTSDTGQRLQVNGDIRINNGAADGGQLVLASSGFSDWNIDNFSGSLRAYYGSTEYLRLTSGGNLLVGTTTDNGARLQVSGTANILSSLTAANSEFINGGQEGSLGSVVRISTTNTNANSRNWAIVNTWDNYGDLTFRVSNSQGGNALSSGASRMVILSSGSVGIGTTSPSSRLHIVGTGPDLGSGINVPNIFVSGASGFQSIGFRRDSDSNGGWFIGTSHSVVGDFGIYQNRGASLTPANRLSISTSGNVLIGTTTDAGGQLQVSGNARFTRANDSGSILRLESVGGAGFDFARSASTGALSIQGSQIGFNNIVLAPTSGNVGIGVTNPQSKLHIDGVLTFTEAGFSTVRLNQIQSSHSDGSSPNNNFRFLVSDGAGNTAERMRVNGSGNVLIGTTTDVGAKLAVNGVISSLGNPFLSNSGNLTMTGTYQTIFTAGTDSAYFLTVQTNAIDGTFAIFALYNENSTERATSTILGNNIQVQFSGNDVQIRSVNGASYTVTYGTIRIK